MRNRVSLLALLVLTLVVRPVSAAEAKVTVGRPANTPVTPAVAPHPFAWLFSAQRTAAVAELQKQEIVVEELREDVELALEVDRIEKITRQPGPTPDRAKTRLTLKSRAESQRVSAGTIVVRSNQPRANLAASRLAPQSEGGLVAQGVFGDGVSEGKDLPVLRLVAATPILTTQVRPLSEKRPHDRPITLEDWLGLQNGSGVVLLTRLRRNGSLRRCHDDYGFPAAGLPTTSSTARWRGSGSSGRQRTTRPSRRCCRGEGATAHAFAGVVRAAEPLAFGAVAACRRRFVGVHARASVTHTQRWHAAHHTSGRGALYQGRFKSFPIQEDQHLLTVLRYVERNALREVGRIGGGVALVQPVASAQRRCRGVGGRGAGAVVAELAAACAVAADGGRAGGAAAIGGARSALRRGVLAGGNGQATALGIDTSPTWPPEEGSGRPRLPKRFKTPDPFSNACEGQSWKIRSRLRTTLHDWRRVTKTRSRSSGTSISTSWSGRPGRGWNAYRGGWPTRRTWPSVPWRASTAVLRREDSLDSSAATIYGGGPLTIICGKCIGLSDRHFAQREGGGCVLGESAIGKGGGGFESENGIAGVAGKEPAPGVGRRIRRELPAIAGGAAQNDEFGLR